MTSKLPVCVFSFDGITDPLALKPVECCESCGLPRGHPRHELPATPAGALELEARRYPDGTEEPE